ncbi:hypothetical protein D3C81_1380080 [compost metagenome]
MHGQREEALARIGLLGADHGDQHADVVGADQHGTAGLTGDAARFEGEGRLTELEFFDNRIHGMFLLFVAFGEIGRNGGETRRILQVMYQRARWPAIFRT